MRNKNKKKILLVGSNEFFSLERMYLRAFKKANCDVKIFHIYNIIIILNYIIKDNYYSKQDTYFVKIHCFPHLFFLQFL